MQKSTKKRQLPSQVIAFFNLHKNFQLSINHKFLGLENQLRDHRETG